MSSHDLARSARVHTPLPAGAAQAATRAKWDNPVVTRMHMLSGYYFGRAVVRLLVAEALSLSPTQPKPRP